MRAPIIFLISALSLSVPALAEDASDKTTSAAAPPLLLPWFLFSETKLSYTFIDGIKYPGFPGVKANNFLDGRQAPAQSLTISHADAWAYGTNFLNLIVLKTGSQTPSGSPAPQLSSFDYGLTALFYNYRGTLSGNALTGTQAFSIPGLVKDVSLVYGYDYQSDSTMYGYVDSRVVGGLNVALDIPVGFFNIGLLMQKDWTRFADLPAPKRRTANDVVARLEVTYKFPLTFTNLPLSLAGFTTYVPPRGDDPHGGKTKGFLQTRTDLVLDVGALVFAQPNRIEAFIGCIHLLNTDGANARFVPGAKFTSFLAGVAFTLL